MQLGALGTIGCLHAFDEENMGPVWSVALSADGGRAVCFRESIRDRTYLVFPSLINERRPYDLAAALEDDVSYRVEGAVENVYAALVVQLGYARLFRRDHHWQNQAQYEFDNGAIGGFRQRSLNRQGEVDLTIYYSKGADSADRMLFQGAFEQERLAMRKALAEGRGMFYCDACGEGLAVPRVDDKT